MTGQGGSASDTFIQNVIAVNDAPTITDIDDLAINGDTNTALCRSQSMMWIRLLAALCWRRIHPTSRWDLLPISYLAAAMQIEPLRYTGCWSVWNFGDYGWSQRWLFE
jgi:hypothetical protein